MKPLVQSSFSGGVLERKSAGAFSETHVAKASGFMLEADGTLRTQPAVTKVLDASEAAQQVAVVDGLLLFRAGSSWKWTRVPDHDDAAPIIPAPAVIAALPFESGQAPVGVVPYLSVDFGWVSAMLIAGQHSGSAYLVWENPDTNAPVVVEIAERIPADTDTVAVPKGRVSCMWGDYLVLGDIEWAEDTSSAYSEDNRAAYGNGIWFSQPGRYDSWDPLDVEFVGLQEGDTGIRSLIPLDMGLLVLTGKAVWLLRGTPSDHEFEQLRGGIGAWRGQAAVLWQETGAVVFVDGAGQVWHTDGDKFLRLDTPLAEDGAGLQTDCAGNFGSHLLVSRGGRTWAFRAYEGEGAWTELVLPDTPKQMLGGHGQQVMFLEDGSVWRMSAHIGDRGTHDGVEQDIELATRTVADGGHRTVFWHRFGLRATGGGTLVDAAIVPRPALSSGGAGVTEAVAESVGERGSWVFRAHGPSVEASCAFTFNGDVTVEQVSWWVHEGREER